MKRLLALFLLGACLLPLTAQEILLPLRHPHLPAAKDNNPRLLPFFDDFSALDAQQATSPWDLRGALLNGGYAPYPPTVGMATLDAFDADGNLYPTTVGTLTPADTLVSGIIRLDSVFQPFARPLGIDDSLFLSFYYLPGGGSGNLWERIGDCPDPTDSLILEFYDVATDTWQLVWGRGGEPVDSLIARTGTDWQFVSIPILDPRYLSAGFRFRFRNYCSLDNLAKPGILSNADQWNIDYILLDKERRSDNRFTRDVAFVHPAASLLRGYTAMPAVQYTPSAMADTLPVTITNLFSQELATHYGFDVYDADGRPVYSYDGGYENAPVFWPARQYQTSPAHARPPVSFAFPSSSEPQQYTILHHLREGVSGDPYSSNDTVAFRQIFDNYFAYDDGTPENGYGITSTASRICIAVRFPLTVPDTLTALDLYFNRTLHDENAYIRFRITIWDDDGGHPGNIIYQDHDNRRPQFQGFNRYVRYALEEEVLASGTIYVGLEQTGSDFLNLGFDRNNDASAHILYNTSGQWQTTILRGALMLRPCFGSRALLHISNPAPAPAVTIHTEGSRIIIDGAQGLPIAVYDPLGRLLYSADHIPLDHWQLTTDHWLLTTTPLLVRVGSHTQKIILNGR